MSERLDTAVSWAAACVVLAAVLFGFGVPWWVYAVPVGVLVGGVVAVLDMPTVRGVNDD